MAHATRAPSRSGRSHRVASAGSGRLSVKDLEELQPQLMYRTLFSPLRRPSFDGLSVGVAEGSAAWNYLEDLQPHNMIGAMFSFLRTLAQALVVVVPAAVTWRVIAVGVGVVMTVRLLFVYAHVPLAVPGLALAIAEGIHFMKLHSVKCRLQRIRRVEERLPSPAGAHEVFRRTLECVEECASWLPHGAGRSPTEWLEGWMLAPVSRIYRENVVEFFAWAFFTKQVSELDSAECSSVNSMLEEAERRFEWGLKPGKDPLTDAIRINFNTLHAVWKPLTYYMGIRALTAATRRTLRLLGFERFTTPSGLAFLHCSPPAQPGQLIVGGETEVPPLVLPIVLIHGLGIGLPLYLRFIRRLCCTHECFVLELPEVSQLGSEMVLSPKEMAETIAMMLLTRGHKRARFIAHSYGTMVLSWVIRERQDIVAKAVLIDPVNLLLAQPDVAYNFLYRRPCNAFTLFMAHFVRWEIYSAHVLMRHFYWHHNVLWKEELPPDSIIGLSSHDDILKAGAIRRYIEEYQQRPDGAGNRIKVLWFEGFFHGEFLLNRAAQLQTMELL